MQKIKPIVSIIILQYHAVDETLKLLKMIKSDVTVPHEVIVIDNESSTILAAKLKKSFAGVIYEQHANAGYGAGNNAGAKLAQGQYLLFLNPDIDMRKETVEKLLAFLQINRTVGAVAPTLLTAHGVAFKYQGAKKLTPLRAVFSLSKLHSLFPNNPVAREYYALDSDRTKPMYLDAIPGSIFMIRSEDFKDAGRFDPKLFMYFEEHDLGNRLKKLGKSLCILPDTVAVHYHVCNNSKTLKKIFAESRAYYFKKYYGSFTSGLLELFFKFF